MKKNKRCGFLTLFCFILLLMVSTATADEFEQNLFKTKPQASLQLTQPQVNERGSLEFGLKLMGGATYLMLKDVNDYLQGMNDLFNDISNIEPGLSIDSSFKPVNIGMDFSGEFFINFTPNVGISIGAGYISAQKESFGEISEGELYERGTYYPQISAIPITFSLNFGGYLGRLMKVMLNGGVGYYLATIDYEETQEMGYPDGSYVQTETWRAKSNEIGFHGGIDFEFGFSTNFAFVIGAKGQYVKFTDLMGDLEWKEHGFGISDSGTEKDQILWFGYNEYIYSKKKYPLITLSENKPTESWWSDVRKAEVDLTGIILQAGIKLTF